jgi:hypothetical protein
MVGSGVVSDDRKSAAPAALVEDGVRHGGRLPARPVRVNPLDEFGGTSRLLRRLRLKEWAGFTLFHPDVWSSVIVQDAQYLASCEFYAHDRRTGTLHQHAANARGGSPALPEELLDGGHCAFEKPGHRVVYDFAEREGRHTIGVDIAATGTAPAVTAELTLDARGASAPLSVGSRLPGGGRMYTHKAVFPAEGVLRVGSEEYVFEAGRDLAVLDEHRSLLPYRTRWLWGTFALPTADGPVGANFADRPELPGEPEESGIWAPGACEPLGEISFTPERPGDPAAPWRIASRDGRLDVVFEPEGRKEVRHQLGLFAIDYFQMYGRYRGVLRAGGTEHGIDGVHGVCESMRARL